MTKGYLTSQGLEQAVKSAAKFKGRPIDRALQEYWRSRFLARVFSEGDTPFVLKGGTGLLARIPDARRTRDLDLAITGTGTVEEAVNELIKLAKYDLGDFFRFQLLSNEPMQADASYRRGTCLKFEAYFGVKRLAVINIDLVVGCSPTGEIEVLHPKNLNGFPLSDGTYRVYPLADHIADKVCGIVELHEGCRSSSRMKDLVDLCCIALNETLSLDALSRALASETHIRGIGTMESFAVPPEWHKEDRRFTRTAKEGSLPELYHDLHAATELAKEFIDSALTPNESNKQWHPKLLIWR